MKKIDQCNGSHQCLVDMYKVVALSGDVVALRELVAKGLDLNQRFFAGYSEWSETPSVAYPPLYYYLDGYGYFGKDHAQEAAKAFSPKFLEELIILGADVQERPTLSHISYMTKDIPNDSPLMIAIKSGNIEAINILLAHGGLFEKNGSEADNDGRTALMKTLEDLRINENKFWNKGKFNEKLVEQIVELLVNAGANVNHVSISGETPLMMAARQHLIGVINFLFENGAIQSINQNSLQGTALIQAIQTVNRPISAIRTLPVVQLLIEKGADINIPNPYSNQTPLDYARHFHDYPEDQRLINFLTELGAKSSKDKDFHYEHEKGYWEYFKDDNKDNYSDDNSYSDNNRQSSNNNPSNNEKPDMTQCPVFETAGLTSAQKLWFIDCIINHNNPSERFPGSSEPGQWITTKEFYRLARLFHPDKGGKGCESLMKCLNEARDLSKKGS